MKLLKSAKWSYIAISAVMILLGIVILIFPSASAKLLCVVIGALMATFGAAKLIGYFSKDLYRLAFQFDLAFGILLLVMGLIVMLHPWKTIGAVAVITGIYLAVDGGFKFQTAMDAKRFGIKAWWLMLAFAVLTVLAGVVLITDPFGGSLALMVLLGISLIIDGMQNIFAVLYTVKAYPEKKREGEYIDIDIK